MGIYKFDKDDAIRFAKQMGTRYYQRGDELIFAECPYCHGKGKGNKDKFAINLNTGQFKCLRASCGAHGNMITLAKDFSFSLGTEADEYYRPQKHFRNIHRKEKPEPKPAAVAYMESRGISEATTNQYNLTTQKGKDNILVFPFYDENGVLTFAKYRKTDFDKDRDKNKEWCESNCKPILFGMNHCNPAESKTLVLTEGQIDSLSCSEVGVKNAVSVPTGANGFTWVPYCWDFLGKFDTLIVFGDHERDTITLLDEMRTRFHGTVKHVRQEDYRDCKDANELLRKHGADAVRKAVENAVPVRNPKIKPLEEVKRVDLSEMERIKTGIKPLDKLLGGLYLGQLVIMTGERGEGKSTVTAQFGTMAISQGYPTFFYSGELMDWYFKAWFERQCAGKRHINAKKTTTGYTEYSVDGNVIPDIERWYSGKAYIYDNGIITGDQNENDAIPKALENAVKQYGCRVLIIDNLMTAISDDLASDLYRQQTKFVRELSLMAKRFNVLVILIAHPRKTNGNNISNDDISGSGNISNLADVVMKYGRPKGKDIPEDTTERTLTVIKNRLSGRTDKNGIKLYFEESSKRISADSNNFTWDLGWETDDGFEDDFDDIIPF